MNWIIKLIWTNLKMGFILTTYIIWIYLVSNIFAKNGIVIPIILRFYLFFGVVLIMIYIINKTELKIIFEKGYWRKTK